MTTAHVKEFKFTVDDKQFEDTRSTLTGADIRQIASIPPNYVLYLEGHGNEEDRKIGNTDIVNLAEHGIEKLFTVPPANFGLCVPR